MSNWFKILGLTTIVSAAIAFSPASAQESETEVVPELVCFPIIIIDPQTGQQTIDIECYEVEPPSPTPA